MFLGNYIQIDLDFKSSSIFDLNAIQSQNLHFLTLFIFIKLRINVRVRSMS